MKTIIGATLLLSVAAQATWAEGPAISSPDATVGVFERVLDVSALTSVRPLPKPASIASRAVTTPVKKEAGITLTDTDAMPFNQYIQAGVAYRLSSTSEQNALSFVSDPSKTPSAFTYALVRDVPASVEQIIAESAIIKPLDPMSAIIEQTLSGSYGADSTDTNADGNSGYDRLLNLAEGIAYDRAPAMVSADAYVSDDATSPGSTFEADIMQTAAAPAPAPAAGFSGTVMGMDPAAAILNSLSKEHLANMSPDQITALVMAAQGRPMDLRAAMSPQVPQGASPQLGQAFAAPLNGIPSLDYRGDALPTPQVISAADVPAGSSPFAANSFVQSTSTPAAAPAPMHVGDGQNLLLKGWTLGLTGSGAIGMYMVGDPGSIIEISEGMVVGPLGALDSLRMENGNIIAEFSSGEVMTSPAALVSMASL